MQRDGLAIPFHLSGLLLSALVTVPVLIEVTGLVPFVRVMRTGLLDGAGRRRALVAVPMRIQVSGNVPFVRVVRTGRFGGLVGHCFLLVTRSR